MEFKIASATDRGLVREKNEDAVLSEEFPLIAVADGMGGHRAGEVASSMAVEILARWKESLTGTSGHEAADKLRDALGEANRTIWERGQQDENLQGMGTTVTAGWIDDGTIALAHVGDTRAYLLRGGKLQQLTHDQNVASDLVRRGRLSEAEAASSPQRHVLLQAIGAEPEGLDIEVASVELKPGDRLLLATDGLHGMLRTSDRIRDILLEHSDPEEACRVLVEEANAAGGEDNISVLVLDAVATDEDAGTTDDSEVRIERPSPVTTAEPEPKRSALRSRWPIVAGLASLVVVLVGALLVMRISNSTLLVAERNGNVVALKGRPGSEGDRATGDVVRILTTVPVNRFPRPVREDLREGVPVQSMAEARRVVSNYIRLITPEKSPTPSPSPSPSASPSGASALPLDGGMP